MASRAILPSSDAAVDAKCWSYSAELSKELKRQHQSGSMRSARRQQHPIGSLLSCRWRSIDKPGHQILSSWPSVLSVHRDDFLVQVFSHETVSCIVLALASVPLPPAPGSRLATEETMSLGRPISSSTFVTKRMSIGTFIPHSALNACYSIEY